MKARSVAGCARNSSRSVTTTGSRTTLAPGCFESTGRRCGSVTPGCCRTGGAEVARIREKKLSDRNAITIEVGGSEAKVNKALVGLRDRFHVEVDDGADLRIHGNIVDHEYEMNGTSARSPRFPSAGSGSATPTVWRSATPRRHHCC
jgi:hypothetical protein